MTTTITSDRGNLISVELQSDYWGEELVNSDRFIGGDEIRVDSYDEHLSLTAVEARSLAEALTAAADRLDAAHSKGPLMTQLESDLARVRSDRENQNLTDSTPGAWAMATARRNDDMTARSHGLLQAAKTLLADEGSRRRHRGEQTLPLAPLFESVNALSKRNNDVGERERSEVHFVADVTAFLLEFLQMFTTRVEDRVDLLESTLHSSSPVVADAGAATPGDPALTVQEGVDTAPGVGAVGCRCNAAPTGSSEAA